MRANPAAAAALLVKANPSLEPKLQLASIEQTLPAALPAGGQPYGYQNPTAWAAFGSWMFTHGLLHHTPNTPCRRSPTSSSPAKESLAHSKLGYGALHVHRVGYRPSMYTALATGPAYA